MTYNVCHDVLCNGKHNTIAELSLQNGRVYSSLNTRSIFKYLDKVEIIIIRANINIMTFQETSSMLQLQIRQST